MIKVLDKIDIVLTIFNQEEIIERVLYGILKNTTTPLNLILVFDGCTDKTRTRALKYLKKVKPSLLRELIIKDTPNLFELRANNFGFQLAQSSYLITLQDDMLIRDYGWERRLTYPLRKFDDVLAVTARAAMDIITIGNGKENYSNRKARELNTLPRNIFAVRDIINRGPIAFNNDYLKELNYLNDKYAPCALDDYEISLRAWKEKKWRVGAFWIDYFSDKAWSKVSAPDSTMKTWESWKINNDRINEDFKEYLDSGIKHDYDYEIKEDDIDYVIKNTFFNKIYWSFRYPIRIDKRVLKIKKSLFIRRIVEIIKFPFIKTIEFFLGREITQIAKEKGIKKTFIILINKLFS